MKSPYGRDAPWGQFARCSTAANLVLCWLWLAGAASAQPGELDTSFGSGGKLTTNFGALDHAEAIALQDDGKVVVVGRTSGGGGEATSDFAVARYHSDGTPDMSFGASGKVSTDFFGFEDGAREVVVQSDGKIVVAGYAFLSSAHTYGRLALARYLSNGSLDSAFGLGGRVTLDRSGYWLFGSPACIWQPILVIDARGLEIQSDGKIVVGAFGVDFGPQLLAVARYESSGLPDTSFKTAVPNGCIPATDPGGSVSFHGFEEQEALADIFGIALQADGKIVIAGNQNGDQQVVLARLLPSGLKDLGFGVDGLATYAPPSVAITERGSDVVLQADGKIVVAGSLIRSNYGATFREAIEIKRYDPAGTLDTSFGDKGTSHLWVVNSGLTAEAVAIDPNGNIIIAGCLETGGETFSFCRFDGPVTDFLLARFSPQGVLDPTFGGGLKTIDFFGLRESGNAIAIQPDGRLVVAGTVSIDSGNQEDFGVVRVFGGTVTCSITVTPTSASIPRTGGTGTVTVTTPLGCPWTAQSNTPWLFVTSGSSGSGNGTVTYQVFASNPTSAPRVGSLTIGGQTFTLTQEPSLVPQIHTHPLSRTVAAGQNVQFTVGATSDSFLSHQWQHSTDGVTWTNVPAALPYQGVTTPFLSITSATTALSGNRYRALVTNAVGLATSNAAMLAVTSFPCAFSINVTEVVVDASGAAGGLDLTTGQTCAWTVDASHSWLAASPGSGMGSARLNYTVAAHSGSEQRTALLVVANHRTVTFRQNGVTTPASVQPPTALIASSIDGNLVRLDWKAPAEGVAPTGYLLEGGLTPGQALASIATGSTSPSFTFAAPTGAFYVRIHTLAGSSKSVASNEIRIFVNVPAPPSPPTNLLGLVNGSNLALAWRNTFDGGAPTSVLLDVTGSLSTTLPLPLADNFSFSGVPPGTYTLSLRARNAAGTSGPSNAVTLTFPSACSGTPLAPANLLASRNGSVISVTWGPAASGPAPTMFVLEVSGAFVGSFQTTGRALSGSVGPGSYTLSVHATNPCGSGPATASQTVVIP